ncbi:MAG TPA: hypothetical protein VFA56_12960 [Gaiellaceae bacterium]|nr:hypothetical protein [Gaiellaceae bacterium]
MLRLAALVAVVLALPTAASAAFTPPKPLSAWPVVHIPGATSRDGRGSCTARTRRHRLLPVACEQPPRSKLRDAGFLILAP